MVRINEKSIFSLFIFAFALTILLNTIGMRSDVALVPRLLGYPLLVLSFIQFIDALFPFFGPKIKGMISKKKDQELNEESEEDSDEIKETSNEMKRKYLLLAWMILFILLIYFVNMISAIVISLFLYLKFMAKEGWMLSILYPLITALIVYLFFVVGMGISYFM